MALVNGVLGPYWLVVLYWAPLWVPTWLPGNPQLLPPKGAKLFQVDAEESLPEVIKTQDIAKAVIK